MTDKSYIDILLLLLVEYLAYHNKGTGKSRTTNSLNDIEMILDPGEAVWKIWQGVASSLLNSIPGIHCCILFMTLDEIPACV